MPALQQLTQPVSKIALVAFVKALQPPVLARGHSIRCRFRYPTPARLRPAGRLDAGNRHAAKACRCSGYASGSGEGVVSGASPVSSDGRSFPASSIFSQCTPCPSALVAGAQGMNLPVAGAQGLTPPVAGA